MNRISALGAACLASAAALAEPIMDNSFFVEEAYNQEARVVQHIFNAVSYAQPASSVWANFTQEWPFLSQEHQLSLSVPFGILGGTTSGIGDVMINYRYQWWAREDGAAASPRLSILVPTGDAASGLGGGTAGLQVNLPVSVPLGTSFVMHVNAGGTWLFQPAQTSLSVAASLIWLADEAVNVMVEAASTSSEVTVSPGVRAAINLGSLQIVPGVAVPFNWSGGSSRTGIFAYLSFEHPF